MARQMKNSGISYFGEIPTTWQVVRNGFLFRNTKTIVLPNKEYQLLSLTTKGVRKKDINDTSGKVPENYNGYQIVHPKDMVMCLFDIDCSAVFSGLSNYYGMISPAYKILKCHSEIMPEYAQYVFSYIGGKRLYKQYSKNLRYTLNIDDFMALKLVLPPLAEQKTIADFLDTKCAEIDGLLADLDAEINVLQDYKKSIIAEVTTQGLNPNVKMKPSGIDWIGEIPAHWQVVPFRSYVVERAEKNLGGRNQNLLALSFALGVTRYADKKYNMDRVKDDFSGYQIVHEKDLVLSPNDIIKGSIFVSEYKGCISPMYRVFSNYDQNTYNLYYLSYHLRTKESGRKFFYIARGLIGEMLDNGKYVTRRMSVSQQDLLKFKVLLPPIEEQDEIVRYLDLKCASIEQAIKDKYNQIETLKAYRASLIYEYVTGKKQVI